MTINPSVYGIINYQSDNFRIGRASDLLAICEDLGIKVFKQDFYDDTLSGLIEKDGDEWSIYVDSRDPVERQRFTIAHELGHFFSWKANKLSRDVLDSKGELEDKTYFTRDKTAKVAEPIEIEANAIAAELLMPKNIIEAMHAEHLNPDEMAKELEVSASALAFRLMNLNYQPLESAMNGQNR
jgi:Zn-dependent peptidase ImmA (M78 family)